MADNPTGEEGGARPEPPTTLVYDPETKRGVTLPADQAYEGYLRGRYQLPAGGEITLVSPEGDTVVRGPTEHANQLIDKGWRFANREQIAKRDAEDHPILAGLEGAEAKFSLGLTDALIRAAGVDPVDLAARRETTAGQVGGVVGLIAGVGGSAIAKLAGAAGKGALVTALDSAVLPWNAVGVAGHAAESVAKDALGRIISNRAVASIAGAAVGGAVENVAFSIGDHISEEALGDANYNADHLLVGAPMAALIGAGVGGTLRSIGELAAVRRGHTAARVPANMTKEEFQEAMHLQGVDVPDSFLKRQWHKVRNAIRSGSEIVGFNRQDVELINRPESRELMAAGKASRDEATRALVKEATTVSKLQKESSSEVFGKLKPDLIRTEVPTNNAPQVLDNANGVLQAIRDKIKYIRDEFPLFGFKDEAAAHNATKGVEALVDRAEERIFKAAGQPRVMEVAEGAGKEGLLQKFEGDIEKIRHEAIKKTIEAATAPEEVKHPIKTYRAIRSLRSLAESGAHLPSNLSSRVFEELEDVKQLLQKPARFTDEVSEIGQRRYVQQMKEAHELLRAHLEDPTSYGRAAEFQRDMNNAFSAREKALQSLKDAGWKFDREGNVDPSSVATYVSKLENVRGDKAIAALQQWHAAQNTYADVVDRYFSGSNLGTRSREAANSFAHQLEETTQTAAIFNAVDRLAAHRNKYVGFGGSGVSGGAVGAGIAVATGPLGVAGAVAGRSAMNAVMDPVRHSMNMYALSRVARVVSEHVADKAGTLVEGAREVSRRGLAIAGPVFSRPNISRLTSLMLFGKTEEERQAAYEERARELQVLSDPDVYQKHAAGVTDGLDDFMPKHADAIQQKGVAAVQYLMRTLPPVRAGSTGDGTPWDALHAQPRPSDSARRTWAQRDELAQDPLRFLDYIAADKVLAHHVETMEAVHPHLLETIRTGILKRASEKNVQRPSARRARTLSMVVAPETTMAAQARTVSLQAQAHLQAQPAAGNGPKARGRQPGTRSRSLTTQAELNEMFPRGLEK